ncbi:solute carrier family 22 member 18-like [Mizuhopecten yessoensis]|uniref:Solute carrier family 22 member 18 n=1 Tax=Mizuhopecten yessoensis TaxID=6573 RepID=A0A210PQZ4_MIZYE|nr:solute carrier family 22 member 18-like [Mizuhopecten yessoensis]OWF38856.1 Solute carrier family 22 member 18 [Mizuhopecten yessoensis]
MATYDLRSRKLQQQNTDRADMKESSSNKTDTSKLSFADEEDKPMMSKSADIKIFGRSFNSTIVATHVNIFLYATCFWIQTGALPYLTKKLGVDMVVFGYLQTTFAIVQLAGGPLFGRFGDLFGGRAAMMLAFASASATYLFLGLADSFPLLFISRLPSVFMHAMQAGQMIVTDIGDKQQRAGSLGMLGLSYGLGMVVGPFIGGLISKYSSEQTAAFAAFTGSVLSILVAYFFIPKTTKKVTVTSTIEEKSSSVFDFKKIAKLVMAPGALFLLTIRAAAGIPIGVFQSMFSVVALETFKLPPEQNGYILSYIGVLTMIVQGLGVSILTKKYSETSILKWSSFSLIFSYLALAFVTDVQQLCIVIAPLVMGLASSNIVISSALK